jgi:hypothetical protein
MSTDILPTVLAGSRAAKYVQDTFAVECNFSIQFKAKYSGS